MLKTPNKNADTSITQAITPVRFLDSPAIKQDSKSSIVTCKTRLDLIIKTLDDNYAKWQLAQKRGLALCTSIEALKTRSLETANKTSNENEPVTLYPKELKPYCDKLCIIASIFNDIAINARESLKQLNALNRMSGVADTIFYRTWKLQQFIDFTAKILHCYEQEAVTKKHVMEELPHCTNRADLIRWTTAWEYPLYVADNINLCFAFLRQEINVEKR